MPDPIITNPFGVNAPQGNIVFRDKIVSPMASDPAGNLQTVSGLSSASPAVVTTAAAHGFINGQTVTISGIVGTGTASPSGKFQVTVLSSTTFSIVYNYAAGTYVSGGTVVGAFQIGQVVAYQGWNGTVSSNTAASPFPTVGLESLTADYLMAGVIIGGKSIGTVPTVGSLLQVCTFGPTTVYVDATVAVGNPLVSSAAHPGQAKTGTATTGKNLGVALQAVTISGAVGALVQAVVKLS